MDSHHHSGKAQLVVHKGAGVTEPTSYIPELVQRLYAIVDELEGHFPGRKFTPDGHLLGSLGEVLAAYQYRLDLLTASKEVHDAKSSDGTMVQIKASQGTVIAIRQEPQHLLVLHIGRDGQASEVYNGPGKQAWENSGPMQKNGQRSISFHRLRQLMKRIPETQRLRVAR